MVASILADPREQPVRLIYSNAYDWHQWLPRILKRVNSPMHRSQVQREQTVNFTAKTASIAEKKRSHSFSASFFIICSPRFTSSMPSQSHIQSYLPFKFFLSPILSPSMIPSENSNSLPSSLEVVLILVARTCLSMTSELTSSQIAKKTPTLSDCIPAALAGNLSGSEPVMPAVLTKYMLLRELRLHPALDVAK